MTDEHPYRAEPDAAFADRLERELLRRLAEPAGATSSKTTPVRNTPPTDPDVNEIDVEVAGGRRSASRLPVVAGGLIAAGLVAALALVVGNTRESQRGVFPPAANGLIAIPVGTGDNDSPLSDIYLVAPDGTGLRALTSTPDLVEYAPTWSADGSRLAFVRTGGHYPTPCTTAGCELVVVDPSTGTETFSAEIPQPELPQVGDSNELLPESLAWSPDGSAIAVTSRGCGIGGCGALTTSVIVDVLTGTLTTFTPPHVAAWSPDGEWLSLAREGAGSPLLVPADAIGTGEIDVAELPGVRTLLEGPEVSVFGVAWMPDSSALLVSQPPVGSIDVVTVADGERRSVIENVRDVMVSPDGSQIAYRLWRFGDVDLSEGPVTTSPESGDTPQAGPWSPLPVSVAAADGSASVVAADRSDPQVVAVSSTPPAWSPDGSLLLLRDDEAWFTVRPDGTGRTAVAASALPGQLNACCGDNRPSWQPLPPGAPAEP